VRAPPNERHARGPPLEIDTDSLAHPAPAMNRCQAQLVAALARAVFRRFTSGAALTARLSGSLCGRPRSRTLTVCAHRGAAEENIECGATLLEVLGARMDVHALGHREVRVPGPGADVVVYARPYRGIARLNTVTVRDK
jgi:hypothetical protein